MNLEWWTWQWDRGLYYFSLKTNFNQWNLHHYSSFHSLVKPHNTFKLLTLISKRSITWQPLFAGYALKSLMITSSVINNFKDHIGKPIKLHVLARQVRHTVLAFNSSIYQPDLNLYNSKVYPDITPSKYKTQFILRFKFKDQSLRPKSFSRKHAARRYEFVSPKMLWWRALSIYKLFSF